MSDDFIIVKIHLMMTFVDMARKIRVWIEHHDSLFCARKLAINIWAKNNFAPCEIYKCKHALVELRSKKTKIIIADLTTKQATSVYRGNKYSCKTTSVVFINAASSRFRTKILWIQEGYIRWQPPVLTIRRTNVGGWLKRLKANNDSRVMQITQSVKTAPYRKLTVYELRNRIGYSPVEVRS